MYKRQVLGRVLRERSRKLSTHLVNKVVNRVTAVSYTHLDVYKRQVLGRVLRERSQKLSTHLVNEVVNRVTVLLAWRVGVP